MFESPFSFNTILQPFFHVAMTDLPTYLEDRIEFDPKRELQHRDVVEVMWNTEQPYFTRRAVEQLLDGVYSDDVVNDRLNELSEVNAIKTDKLGNTHLYYINRPESEWPVPSDIEIADGGTVEGVNVVDLVTLKDRQALRDIATGQAITANAFLFAAVGGGLAFGTLPISSGNPLMQTTILLLTVAIILILLVKGAELFDALRREGIAQTVGRVAP